MDVRFERGIECPTKKIPREKLAALHPGVLVWGKKSPTCLKKEQETEKDFIVRKNREENIFHPRTQNGGIKGTWPKKTPGKCQGVSRRGKNDLDMRGEKEKRPP